MLCEKCKILMKSGTNYERKNKRSNSSRRYDECPICHFRKYNSSSNSQEKLKEK